MITSVKNSSDTIGKRTRDLPTCLNQLRHLPPPLNPVHFDLVSGCVVDLVGIWWLVDSVPLPGIKNVAFWYRPHRMWIWLSRRRRRNFNNNMAQYTSHSYCDIRSLVIGVPFAVRTQILLYASLFVPKPECLLPWLPECNSQDGKLSSVQHEVKRGMVSESPLIFKLTTRWRWVFSFTHRPLYLRGIVVGTNWLGRWMGARANVDAQVKRQIFCPVGNRVKFLRSFSLWWS